MTGAVALATPVGERAVATGQWRRTARHRFTRRPVAHVSVDHVTPPHAGYPGGVPIRAARHVAPDEGGDILADRGPPSGICGSMPAPVDDVSPFGAYSPNALQRRLYRCMAGLYGHGWAGKRIFGWLRWLDQRLASREMADVWRFGCAGGCIARAMCPTPGCSCAPTLRPGRDGVPPRPGDAGCAFIDVGANCGVYGVCGWRPRPAGWWPSSPTRSCSVG